MLLSDIDISAQERARLIRFLSLSGAVAQHGCASRFDWKQSSVAESIWPNLTGCFPRIVTVSPLILHFSGRLSSSPIHGNIRARTSPDRLFETDMSSVHNPEDDFMLSIALTDQDALHRILLDPGHISLIPCVLVGDSRFLIDRWVNETPIRFRSSRLNQAVFHRGSNVRRPWTCSVALPEDVCARLQSLKAERVPAVDCHLRVEPFFRSISFSAQTAERALRCLSDVEQHLAKLSVSDFFDYLVDRLRLETMPTPVSEAAGRRNPA